MKNLLYEDGHSMEIRARLSRRLPPLPSPTKPRNLTEAKQLFKKKEVSEKDMAFRDWLELCKCTGDAKSVFKFTGRNHRKDMAFKRWLELCKCPSDAKSAFRYTNNRQREDWARTRIKELS